MGTRKPNPTMTETLKSAIRESGLTTYRISHQTGIADSNLLRFMAGKTSMRLDRADRLAEYLGLHLVRDPDATPPEPTPANLARPTLTKKAKRTTKRRTR